MKVLTNKQIAFVTRVKEGWTKEELMERFSLDEDKYDRTLADVQRMEREAGRELPVPKSEHIPIIQVYSPEKWHGEQAIIMNEAGRMRLLKALKSGSNKSLVQAFVSDGEGFELYIQVLSDEEIKKLWLPYIDDMCHGDEGDNPDPRYPVTPEEQKVLTEQGKDTGEWKVIH